MSMAILPVSRCFQLAITPHNGAFCGQGDGVLMCKCIAASWGGTHSSDLGGHPDPVSLRDEPCSIPPGLITIPSPNEALGG